MAQIPLSLVTGFLGSGKTTFLRHVSRRLAGRRIVYLVNEFSSLNVDGVALAEIGPDVICVPGGSIFCKCLVGEFIDRLLAIPRSIEGVIVEASGIADPKVVSDMLRQTKLDRLYNLVSIISIADPGSFPKLLATLPNIRAQVEAADIVLLNKVDRFDESRVAATQTQLRRIDPRADPPDRPRGRGHRSACRIAGPGSTR